MNAMDLFQLLARKPFPPMRVVLKDGRMHVIPTREFAVVAETFLDIGIQRLGQPQGIWGGFVRVPLEDITRVEAEPKPNVAKPA